MNTEEARQLQEKHGAWRLLRSQNAPLVISFLGRFFIEDNNGAVAASKLQDELSDELYELELQFPGDYPRDAGDYLMEWAAPERGWLRRFYPVDSHEVHYDATPVIEKAYRFVESLQKRSFVGTESRLHSILGLLREIVQGSETDPELQLRELEAQRAEIDVQIAHIKEHGATLLDDTAVRERYQLFASTARELLSDFREVEENFRALDREARAKIALWSGGRGDLVAELIAGRSDITTSDQGKSFQAFYDFLLSESRQTELNDLLTAVQLMPAIDADRRVRFVHHDWADAAERAQQTVRNLSEQLRRFLADQVWVENRRVTDIVREVQQLAIAVREDAPSNDKNIGLKIDVPGIPIELPFERPLYGVQPSIELNSVIDEGPALAESFELLLNQHYIDTARLAENVRALVPLGSSSTLEQVLEWYPISEGAAEIIGYLNMGVEDIKVELNNKNKVTIDYAMPGGEYRRITMPEVVITRK